MDKDKPEVSQGAGQSDAAAPEYPYEVPFEVRGSTIQGHGAFASRPIKNGETVAEYCGIRLPKAQSQVRQEAGNSFIFIIDDETDIDGDVPWNPARFLNHSCEPNCEAVWDEARIFILARQDIAVGEELTFNYGYDVEEYMDYPCRCGARGCVGYMVAEEHFDTVRAREHGVVTGQEVREPAPKP